jgi:ion channel-forming bestrophin family protein
MVITTVPNWIRIARQVWLSVALFVILAVIVTLVNTTNHPFRSIAVPDLTITLLGAALGLLLGFRTNSAYDRWWEARKLWGRLVNSSRSLARQAISFSTVDGSVDPEAPDPFARELVYLQIAYVHALRCALRKQQPWEDIGPFLRPEFLAFLREQTNVPAAMLQRMGDLCVDAVGIGVLTELRLQRLDTTLSDLTDVQGGCERIKNTPLPRQYDTYPELIVKVYCFLLPFVLVDRLKYLTPAITLIIGAAFLVLNRIGKNLEDPFEDTVYDTPMTALSRTIEINLRQQLGEKDLPVPLVPVHGVLM